MLDRGPRKHRSGYNPRNREYSTYWLIPPYTTTTLQILLQYIISTRSLDRQDCEPFPWPPVLNFDYRIYRISTPSFHSTVQLCFWNGEKPKGRQKLNPCRKERGYRLPLLDLGPHFLLSLPLPSSSPTAIHYPLTLKTDR